jgi:hypothetical protein
MLRTFIITVAFNSAETSGCRGGCVSGGHVSVIELMLVVRNMAATIAEAVDWVCEQD